MIPVSWSLMVSPGGGIFNRLIISQYISSELCSQLQTRYQKIRLKAEMTR